MSTASPPHPVVLWQEGGEARSALWRSENHSKPPARVQVVDDTIKADHAYRLACEGTALLWRGDFQNARQLLQAMARRMDRKSAKTSVQPAEAFHLHRQAQAQRARVLGMLLVELGADYHIALRRAPDVKQACLQAYGEAEQGALVSLREVQGLIGAYEWRKKGVEVPALGARIHPHYSVFSPVRGEYVDLVAQAPLPDTSLAFDIGTGSGVLAAVLAKRGVKRVLATDQDARALACARDNMQKLGLEQQVEILERNLFPEGQAPLIVCNPPWIPAKANAAIEYAIYDPDSAMLKGFLSGAAAHLAPAGEAWLVMSDIAEHLGLRTRQQLLDMVAAAGLKVLGRIDAKPRHSRASDASDPLHQARAAEVTSLWRLAAV
ncbi:class I SAM-dependent methyltransferase [Methylobacillus arboreus]|uniref:methyltransferase n=1 Tax=Methylobacillus arboreus TaxID=755170 RepID=UPI001E5BFCDF|nr:class I SAM-dependent methyltransferase [Methylobacillus arboreus]MCB5189557.1 class I SAM-dependent methyltransferase [Methylobacillus arboreus]